MRGRDLFRHPATRVALATLGALGVAVLPSACGGGSSSAGPGGGGPTEPPCFDYAAFDGAAPAVFFRADVLPILRNSCALSESCHGKTGLSDRPFLGLKNSAGEMTDLTIDKIFADTVGVASGVEPAMSVVEPGAPERSFLMHKVDGTLSCDALECAAKADCGDAMPDRGQRLPEDTRNVLRRWIAQGAKND